MDEVSNFSPAIAVPITVKMPEPMTAPIPSEVSETGPRVLRNLRSGSSDSAISLSMDLQQKAWRGRVRLLCWKNAIRGVYSEKPAVNAPPIHANRRGTSLPLALAAHQFLHFFLVGAAWGRPGGLGSGLFARRALYL